MRKYFQILMLAGFSMLAVNCSDKKNEAVEQQEEKPKVKLAAVSVRDVKQIEEYTATVESDVKNNISSNSVLRIEKINVEVGDMVRKGQLLVQMNTAMLQQLKLQIENQRVEFNRVDELYKVGGASKSEWDNAKMMLDVNETQYANRLENTQLLSPIDGVVTARNYDNGDMYGGQPIFVVQRINPVKIMINVSEALYSYVKKGMGVNVAFDALEGQTFEGKVTRITPSIDAATRTFAVEVQVANGKEIIKPGMYARVTMNYGSHKNIVVPDVAVVKMLGSGNRYIYVYKQDGTVSYQRVELGRRMNDKYEILSGISDGDEVVTSGHAALKDGLDVERVNE